MVKMSDGVNLKIAPHLGYKVKCYFWNSPIVLPVAVNSIYYTTSADCLCSTNIQFMNAIYPHVCIYIMWVIWVSLRGSNLN